VRFPANFFDYCGAIARDQGSNPNAVYLRGVTQTQTFDRSASGSKGTQASIRVPLPSLE
jgi:hypothetical protein